MAAYVLLLYLLNTYTVNSDCTYAILPWSSLPEAMDECNEVSWRHDLKQSMKRQCDTTKGIMYYELFYDKKCKDVASGYERLDSRDYIHCYIDKSIKKCKSVLVDHYVMTYNSDGEQWSPYRIDEGSPLVWTYRPKWNDSDTDIADDSKCYDENNQEQFGHHYIYDECLRDPSSDAIYPYIKGDYSKAECSYTLHYYSDSDCNNEIGDAILYNDKCQENIWDVVYSYHVKCPWKPNTVWIIVFCFFGCCCVGCICVYYIDEDRRKSGCFCWKEERRGYVRRECSFKCCSRDIKDDTRNNFDEIQRRRRARAEKERERRNDAEIRKRADKKNKELELENKRNKQEYRRQKKKEKMETRQRVIEKNKQTECRNDNDDDEIIKQQRTLSYSAMNCVICLDVLFDHDSSKLLCGHRFHTHCIEEYNETNQFCPLCRKAVVFK